MTDAEHEESAPAASTLLISQLACSLVGTTQAIALTPGSIVQQCYGQTEVFEEFSCTYGLNPRYQALFAGHALDTVGTDSDGAVRVVELHHHPFFVATLFLPQMRSSQEQPHPLITAYIQATLHRER